MEKLHGDIIMTDCIFCKIISGKESGSIVYQDDCCIAIMDLFPIQAGHVLVVPLQHEVFLAPLDSQVRSHLLEIANRVINAQKISGFHCSGHNLMINDGPVAGQHVPHVHLHVIPRREGDFAKTAFNFMSRNLNYFGLAQRRKELDNLAKLFAKHMV